MDALSDKQDILIDGRPWLTKRRIRAGWLGVTTKLG